MPANGYKRKYPTVEDLADEFDQVLGDYTDEVNYLHTRYIAEFIAKYPAKYPQFNLIKSKEERTRKITLCFGERADFELFHTTRQGNNGTVWRRIQPKEQEIASVAEETGCLS